MRGQRLFLSAYACSGAASLLYQVVWTRLLSLQLGHTVAAVGAVLAAFMGGLAAGALIGGHLASRLERAGALRMYAVTECARVWLFFIDDLSPVHRLFCSLTVPSVRFSRGQAPTGLFIGQPARAARPDQRCLGASIRPPALPLDIRGTF